MTLEAMVKTQGDANSEGFEIQEHGYVSVRDGDGNQLIIGKDEDGNLQVYLAYHATLTIDAETNRQPHLTLDSDEYPYDLTVMDSEDAVDTLQLKELNI